MAAGQRLEAGDELLCPYDRLHRAEANEGHLEKQLGEERAGDGLAALHELLEHAVQELGGAPLDLSTRFGDLGIGERGEPFRCVADCDDGEVAEVADQLLGKVTHVAAVGSNLIDRLQRKLQVLVEQGPADGKEAGALRGAKQRSDLFHGGAGAGKGDDLVELAERIAHTACGLTGHQVEDLSGDLQLLLLDDVGEAGDDIGVRDASEIEALAAAEDGHRDLVDLGGGEDEVHIGRRLFEGLQQCVEGLGGEHVDFVDDVDFVAVALRSIADAVAELADFADATVGGTVDLDDVDGGAALDLRAGVTAAAGARRGPGDTVERHGDDACRGGLSDAAGTCEQHGVGHALQVNGVGKCPRHMVLAREVGEGLRPPFAGEDDVGHRIQRGKKRCRTSHTPYHYRCSLPGLAGFAIVRRKVRHNSSSASMGSAKVKAERVGFEPTLRLPVNTRSRRAPSTTRPPILRVRNAAAGCGR